MIGMEEQLAILGKGVAELVGEEGLRKRISETISGGPPLRVKLGMDPTAPDLHLGHAVVLRKIRQLQDLGHHAVLIIGDFTGRIGDPTGRSKTRRALDEDEVKENARTYERQLFRILDPSRTELVFNSVWLSELRFEAVLRLAAGCTVAQMLEREDFATRFDEHAPIGIHEFLYPLMQGYDSVAVRADLELGGTDQRFNILMGRTVQRRQGMEPQAALFMPLLEGVDGVEKMSKSLGNSIGIDEEPGLMFEKVMSIPDASIVHFFELATDLPPKEVERVGAELDEPGTNPRNVKARLSREIVRLYHGEEAAAHAARRFNQVFHDRGLPDDMPGFSPLPQEIDGEGRLDLPAFLHRAGLAASRSDARRAIQQGGVRVDGSVVHALREPVRPGSVLQVGKRGFVRLTGE